jgi:hypothetical protein
MTLDDVTLDTAGWTPNVLLPLDRSWWDARGDAVRVRLFDEPAPESTLDGSSALRSLFRRSPASVRAAPRGVRAHHDERPGRA